MRAKIVSSLLRVMMEENARASHGRVSDCRSTREVRASVDPSSAARCRQRGHGDWRGLSWRLCSVRFVAFDRKAAPELDAVLAAALLAFGFIYIHPFADGNGRLHRYLIHHILAERGFNPPGMVFPVSAAILDRINDYRRTLESYSARLLPFIKWEPTDKGNVRVLNETADFYRFFDATPHAEFLYECVARTIDIDLPAEAKYLQAYDTFRRSVTEIVDMPDGTLDLLFRFLRQNTGVLSKRGREKELCQTDGR